jgi:hypothetical protein
MGGAGVLWLAGGLLRVSMKLRRQGWILRSDLRTVLAVTSLLERLAVMLSLGRRRRRNQNTNNGLSQ